MDVYNLPADQFPIVIEFYTRSGGTPVHVIRVDKPGAQIHIPPLSSIHREPIDVRIETGDGTVQWEWGPGLPKGGEAGTTV